MLCLHGLTFGRTWDCVILVFSSNLFSIRFSLRIQCFNQVNRNGKRKIAVVFQCYRSNLDKVGLIDDVTTTPYKDTGLGMSVWKAPQQKTIQGSWSTAG